MRLNSLSFEFFPPKTLEGKDKLLQAAQQLAALAPEYFSVTCGAGGTTQQGTPETVAALFETTQIPVAPHLTCIGSQRSLLEPLLLSYAKQSIQRIVTLRGDLPSGSGLSAPGEFRHASQLVAFVREILGANTHISVAAYPEFHPETNDWQKDIAYFAEKVRAGANSAITQYFYNPEAYFYFRDDCARLGIHIPIFPGIMPITNYQGLLRFSRHCGADIPRWLQHRLATKEENKTDLLAFGTDVVVRLCRRLIDEGVPGLHFYTLNNATASLKILSSL